MKKAYAVIGANFGDEGKGLVTDYLAAQVGPSALVVRFNGGAQAGHTVTTPSGERHVFGHFGSGSFAGCATFLSRFFALNPMVFLKEKAVLESWGFCPIVWADPRAPVTTPFDILINQGVEASRGANRHGSCGLGFAETVERTQQEAYRLTFADLFDAAFTRARLGKIREEWVGRRLSVLGCPFLPSPWRDYLESPDLIDRFLEDAAVFCASVRCAPAAFWTEHEAPLVFEGAQGLLLDPAYGRFPYVTRSSTGLAHLLVLAGEAGVADLTPVYVTRAYLTRHGAGPLPYETFGKPYPGIEDPTNVPNAFQGSLRFAWLDADRLAETIQRDLARAQGGALRVRPALAVTCLDQIGRKARMVLNAKRCDVPVEDVAGALAQQVGIEIGLSAYGPTRDDVRKAGPVKQEQQAVHFAATGPSKRPIARSASACARA